jgi:hypothetical protein
MQQLSSTAADQSCAAQCAEIDYWRGLRGMQKYMFGPTPRDGEA